MKTTPATPGKSLALLAGGLIIADTILMAVVGVTLLFLTGFGLSQLQTYMHSSPLPFVVYTVWALGVFGSAAAIVAIVLYRYRARWFWRCLIVASLLWLFFPPIHTLIGLVSLLLLIRFRDYFSGESAARVTV